MPLIDDPNDPAVVDAFGVRFTMTDREKRVRCHVFKAAIDAMSPEAEDLLSSFKKNRGVFARLASNLYDAGHRNPWIDAVMAGPSS